MDYFIFVPSLLLGMLLGLYILKRFRKPWDIVWFIFITFFLINILIVVLDRYILNGSYIMEIVKDSVPGLLIGVYLYLIMAVLGIFNNPKNI